jgi:Secretion system C-terminal sorting domain
MKKTLLLFFFAFIINSAFAQTEQRRTEKGGFTIYPNPATEFIAVNDEENVRHVTIINMVGRKVKSFEVEKGRHYEITDLPNGLYVVQLVGKNNKVLAIQRLTKKS